MISSQNEDFVAINARVPRKTYESMQEVSKALEQSLSSLISNSVTEYLHQVTSEKGLPTVDLKSPASPTLRKKNLLNKKRGYMSEHSPDSQEPNSLEVNFNANSWQTEFYEEIKSVRLNGQKIAEIRDLMTEMKSLKDTTDRKIQILVFTIFLLSILSLGIVVLGVQHLNKLKAEKVNEIVEAGIHRFDMTDQTFMPVEAFRQLSEFNQVIHWDKNTERWYIERS